MVPREAGRGRSFKGAGLYYLHDKDALTSERVAFTHTENVPTDDPEKALKWMAWTAIHAEDLKRESGSAMTGRACAKPVFTFSLSWHPEQEPKKWEMIGAGRQALTTLGLQDHETVMVAHAEREHPHLHMIVNLVHPETGRADSLSHSRKKLSVWAEEYEREHGKIYCDQRVENNAKRAQAKTEREELDPPKLVTDLYRRSDSAAAFQAALAEEGLTLAQGKRLVIVDEDGKTYSLSRQIEGVTAKQINAKLEGIELPDVDDIRGRIREETERKEQEIETEFEKAEAKPPEKPDSEMEALYFDRDEQDRQSQEAIIDAGISQPARKPRHDPPTARRPQRPSVGSSLINALQDRHHAELDRFYTENHHSRRRVEALLEQQYGEHERSLSREIDQLDSILKNSGIVRKWFLKATGQIPKHPEEELQNMRLSLANIEWRKTEAHRALQVDAERRREAISARHEQERQRLKPPDSEPAHDRVQHPTQAPDTEEDFGPTLEY